MKMGDMYGGSGLVCILVNQFMKMMGVLNTKKGGGTANTALAFHAGRLLALYEQDLPYVVREGTIELQ
jgi:hypothetical protein